MSKKIIVVISSCLAVILVAAGMYYFSMQKKDKANIVQKQSDNNTGQATINNLAQALNQTDSSSCNGLANEADKAACRQAYVIKETAATGDLGKCDVVDKALADDCSAQASFSLAIRKKDKKYCDNIKNQDDKNNCLDVLKGMGVK